jgi:hypothetical protein
VQLSEVGDRAAAAFTQNTLCRGCAATPEAYPEHVARKPAQRSSRTVEVAALDPDKFLRHPAPLPVSSIHGHDRAWRTLTDAMRSGRVHHAWIFHGPAGVGKFTSAVAFASLLLDPTAQATFSGEFVADPESTTQRLLAASNHPDLRIIVKELASFHEDKQIRDRKQTNIPAAVIRDSLVRAAGIAPMVKSGSLAGKVFIVDDADLMDSAAQNALLKVFEEPPARVVIILVTSNENYLLPTVRSRSQRVYFQTLAQPDMHAWLTTNRDSLVMLREEDDDAGDEGVSKTKASRENNDDELMMLGGEDPPSSQRTISPEEEKFLIEFAAGSPGAFTSAYEYNIYSWWKSIGPLLVQAEKGQHSIDLGPAIVKHAAELKDKLFDDGELASKEAAGKVANGWMFRLVGSYLSRRLREAARSAKGASAVKPYLTMLDRLLDAEDEVDSNVNITFVADKLAGEIVAAGRAE